MWQKLEFLYTHNLNGPNNDGRIVFVHGGARISKNVDRVEKDGRNSCAHLGHKEEQTEEEWNSDRPLLQHPEPREPGLDARIPNALLQLFMQKMMTTKKKGKKALTKAGTRQEEYLPTTKLKMPQIGLLSTSGQQRVSF